MQGFAHRYIIERRIFLPIVNFPSSTKHVPPNLFNVLESSRGLSEISFFAFDQQDHVTYDNYMIKISEHT